MNNHLNMMPKQAKFNLKCTKMRWWLELWPRPRWGSLQRSPDPLIVRENPSHHKFLATPLQLGSLFSLLRILIIGQTFLLEVDYYAAIMCRLC